ncbi:response regulator [Candidatus Marithioploca araucensis]|uniref:histidine kinase n=1 Tax=Candidatus Marithioploca araucensis TaxID=70273 RepID=A0ABT7VQQ4_9GAMM|nr:response regulator [Candidatus Marithioploca araucensis]
MSKLVILCVDDEQTILESLEIELHKALDHNYRIELAESGEDALALIKELQENGYEIAVVVADYLMPNMRGSELLERIHTHSPRTLSIMLTGQAGIDAIGYAVNYANLYRYIAKPWQAEELRLAVKEAVYTYKQEKMLAEENAKLQRLDELKNEFLSNISHELRTPLNSIIGFSNILYKQIFTDLSEDEREMLSTVVQNSRRLESLVNDILDFSRLKNKNIEPKLKLVNIQNVIRTVLSMHKSLLTHNLLKLINAVPNNIPLVFADENRTQQVLYNLIGNAIKFTEQGHVEISAEVVQRNIVYELENPFDPAALEPVTLENVDESEFSYLYLAITVSDTGIGIPADKISRIFESFEQIDGSSTRLYDGTGLGLSLTKQLIHLQNGEIFVKSVVDKGSQFTFILPIVDKPEREKPKRSLSREKVFIDEGQTRGGIDKKSELYDDQKTPAFKILIIDDNPASRQVLAKYLYSQEYVISSATSGIEALTLLDKGLEPDLILLDVMMPHMNGYEVTMKIREKWSVNELPILLISVKDQVSDVVTGLEIGANDYITKPVTQGELLARITTHLTLKSLEAENRLTANIFQSSQVGIMITDAHVRIIKVNQTYLDVFGYTAKEILGRNPSIINSGKHERSFYQALWDTVLAKGYWSGEIINCCKNGELWKGILSISAIKDKHNKTTHYTGFFINK